MGIDRSRSCSTPLPKSSTIASPTRPVPTQATLTATILSEDGAGSVEFSAYDLEAVFEPIPTVPITSRFVADRGVIWIEENSCNAVSKAALRR